MLRIKLFAMTLAVGLAGVICAAGQVQTGSHHNHGAQSADNKAPACCRKKDAQKDGQTAAMSCDKDGCCQGHKADSKQTAAAEQKHEGCCDCCGASCAAHAGR